MFSNANVIFRTKFTDGVSTVSRTLGVGRSSNVNRSSTDENNGNKLISNKRSNKNQKSRADGIEN